MAYGRGGRAPPLRGRGRGVAASQRRDRATPSQTAYNDNNTPIEATRDEQQTDPIRNSIARLFYNRTSDATFIDELVVEIHRHIDDAARHRLSTEELVTLVQRFIPSATQCPTITPAASPQRELQHPREQTG